MNDVIFEVTVTVPEGEDARAYLWECISTGADFDDYFLGAFAEGPLEWIIT